MKKIFSIETAVIVLFIFSIVPFVAMEHHSVSLLNGDIDFAHKELLGLEYNKSLKGFLEHTQQHRGMTRAYLSGDISFKEKRIAKVAEIEGDIAAIDKLDQKYGAVLKTTEEWKRIKQSWHQLRDEALALQLNESFKAHTALIEDILLLMSTVGDTSNLILDPELDTHHLSRTIVTYLPLLKELVGQARGIGVGVASRGVITADEKSELLVLLGKIEIEGEEFKENIEVALKANPGLKAQLEIYIRESAASVNAFSDVLKNRIINVGNIDIQPSYFFAEGTKTIESCSVLYDAIAFRLNKLLQSRIDRFSMERNRVQFATLIMTFIISCGYILFAYNLTKRKKAEQKLRESNTLSQSLLEAIPFGMDIVDEEGNILFCNQKLEGLAGKEAIGKKCWQMYKDDKKQCELCPLKKGMPVGEVRLLEAEGAFGGKTILIFHIGIIYHGRKALLEIFQDMTEQKRTEKELKDSRDILQRKIGELERFYRLAVDRELRIAELKKQLDTFEQELKTKKGKDV